ncbi:MAG: phospholipase [Castellaniella sp.]|nr:phospholipase A [Castellaniella sp.]TAN25875.1 MAG: phospholipase [Castellaniella sp.]
MPAFCHALSRTLPRLLLAALLLPVSAAQAGMLYHLASPQGTPGATVELQGLLYNDTGGPLTAPTPQELDGEWVDAAGHTIPAHFHLRTSPDTANLPANTFTRMIWTGRVPTDAKGLMTLRLNGSNDTLLALQVGGGTASEHVAQTEPQASTPAPTAQVASAPALSPFDTFRNAISPYDPIYFIVGNNGGATARFQLSLKYRLFSPQDPEHPRFMDNWYLGYTQTSLWDLHSNSIPFVDTTYNPSLFWARESLLQSSNKHWFLGLNTGFEHKSNGKAGDDSRSLNDLYIQPEFNYRSDSGSTLTFMPRFKHYVWTDPSMGYPNSLGYVDWKLRWAQDDGLVLSGLYRQGTGGRNATQIEAAWPLKRTFLHMNGYLYAQYFRGYGETLLGYDQKNDPQFRVGIAFVP